MRILLTGTLFCLATSLFAQQPLVGNKDGLWTIFQGANIVELPKTYIDVGNPDQHGISYFSENGQYGLINAKGEVLVKPNFRKIESLGSGYFGVVAPESNFILHHRDGSTMLDSCIRWEQVENAWVKVTQKNKKTYLLNGESGKKWQLDSNNRLVQHAFDYVLLHTRTGTTLLDKVGREINLEGGFSTFGEDYLRIKSKEEDLLIFKCNSMKLPQNMRSLAFKDDIIEYSLENRTVHLTREGEVRLDVPYSKVEPGGIGRYIVSNDFKYGLIDSDGNELIPLKYSSLQRNGSNYFARTSQGLGVVSSSGREIVPCQYQTIYKSGAFYQVASKLNLVGLYSTKLNKLILNTSYERVAVSEDKIRAWLSDNLRILSYDKDHNITDDLTLNNTVSKFNRLTGGSEIDARLYGIGWFNEASPIFDEEGFRTGEILKWGLKDNSDSVITKPRFLEPIFVPQMNFSLIFSGRSEEFWYGSKLQLVHAYTPIDVTNGRFLDVGRIIALDTADIFSRNYIRYCSENGLGYITTDNKVHPLVYMDVKDHSIIRVASSKATSYQAVEEDDPEGVYFYNSNLMDDTREPLTWLDGKEEVPKIKFLNSEWNFLDTNGTLLFDEPFEFVERFKMERSIVKRNGKWGVCSKDSVIIPTIYSSVKRVAELGDTVFQVQLSRTGTRFMDTLTNDLPIRIDKVLKNSPYFAIVQSDKMTKVINSDYEEISSTGKSLRLVDGDAYFEKRKKEFVVFDRNGFEIVTLKVKPRGVLFDHFILFEKGSNFGLTDQFGDTLLEPIYKSILARGAYIIATGNSANSLLNSDGEVVFEAEAGTILADSGTENFAHVEGAKVTVYDRNGNKLKKFKNIIPDFFENNVLIETGRQSRYVSLIELTDSLPEKITEAIVMNGNGYLLVCSDESYYFDQSWKVLNDGLPFERAKYLGEGAISAKGDTSMILFSPFNREDFPRGTRFGQYNDGKLLVEGISKQWFVDQNFEMLFNRKFKFATEFIDGYAAVQEKNGWTIIDKNGYPKSLSSYQQIKALGNNIFSTPRCSMVGLISASGTQIVPPEFERITVLQNGVIQGVKDGTIFYFSENGTPIPY